MNPIWLWAVLGIILVLAPACSTSETGRRLDWGLYQIYTGASRFEVALDETLSELDSAPQYLMFYRDLGRGFPRRGCEIIRERGATPILSLELWHWGSGANSLPDIRSGRFDAFFRKWARDAKAYEGPVFLRFGFEMNGDWFSWGNQPSEFIECWRRVHGLFQDEQANNVVWLWSPNAISIPREDWNAIEAYYPGDEFVDWVGLDGYNFGDNHSEWHSWESFEDVFGPALQTVRKEFAGKPVMIAEFGTAPGDPGDKARWIRETHAAMVRRPEIRAAIWFNLDKRREGEPDWSLDSEASALAAFNETFARPISR